MGRTSIQSPSDFFTRYDSLRHKQWDILGMNRSDMVLPLCQIKQVLVKSHYQKNNRDDYVSSNLPASLTQKTW